MSANNIEIVVPDIGGAKDVEVIEIYISPGDAVTEGQDLITLESDKAAMDIPSPCSGVVVELCIKPGDKVNEGDLFLIVCRTEAVAKAVDQPESLSQTQPVAAAEPEPAKAVEPIVPAQKPEPASEHVSDKGGATSPGQTIQQLAVNSSPDTPKLVYAGPSVRQFAREMDIDVALVQGSGPKGRILREDVVAYIKSLVKGAAAQSKKVGGGLDLLPWPDIDFSAFGPVREQPLSRIKKISGANLHRNWVQIPHVTNHDKADITDLESFRKEINRQNEKNGLKVSILPFIVKACALVLKRFPQFNASLQGDTLILKDYYHLGVAVDTPKGLVVPVIRDVDKKGIVEIAEEMTALAQRARDGKLKPTDMQGGTFSISSLGGIGGTAFNPIINAPEVAILGVCRAEIQPRWNGEQFIPRLMVPFSLAWDHRVVDGVEAAKFNALLAEILTDFRRALL